MYPKRINNKGPVLLAGPNPNNGNNWGHARWRGVQTEYLTYSGPGSSWTATDINDNDIVVGTFDREAIPFSETEVKGSKRRTALASRQR